jgi:ribosomal protein S27E
MPTRSGKARRCLRLIGLGFATAMAMLSFVATAVASPLTSPAGAPYTSTIKATSTNWKIDGSFVTVECSDSSLEGKVESHSSTSASGKLSSLAFSGCNYTVTVLKPGSLEIHTSEASPGTITSSGAEVSIHTSVGTCTFTTSNTDIGTLTDSSETGGTAALDLNSAKIPRTGGNFLCGEFGTSTGGYEVTTPTTLYVDPDPSPLTSPAGAPYTSTIKATSTNWKIDGSFVTVECSDSSLEGKVESHSSTSASGKLSSLAFSGCNYTVTVLKPGSLEIHTSEASPGTITSSGAEVSIHTSVGTCTFTTSNTDIGTLTDSSETGGTAALDLNSAKIPRTGGNFLCGEFGTSTGGYEVTTPTTLYVDPDPSPLTSPEGAPYTSTIKAESANFKLDGSFVTVECSSSFEGKVESHSSTGASGNLSGLAFSGCNYAVEVKKPGSLQFHATGGGNATVTSSGAEISINTSVGTCVFTTSGTDIGTLTGSNATNATVDLAGNLLRTGGNFLCGKIDGNTLTGSYKITTPSTLYVDA